MPASASTPWWGTGWFWGEEEEIDFVELTPKESLARGEKCVRHSFQTISQLKICDKVCFNGCRQ